MLEGYGEVTAHDYVMDLGSGDGRTVLPPPNVRAGDGNRIQPEMVICRGKTRSPQRGERATFIKATCSRRLLAGDRHHDVPVARRSICDWRPKILDMKPGTRVVSNTFTMEDWEPDETQTVGALARGARRSLLARSCED